MEVAVTVACVAAALVALVYWLHERRERAAIERAIAHANAALAAGDFDRADQIAATAIGVPDLDEDLRLQLWLVHVQVSLAQSRHAEVVTLLGDPLRDEWRRDLRVEVALARGEDELALQLLAEPRATPLDEAARLNSLGRLRLQRAEYAEAEKLLTQSLDLLSAVPPDEEAESRVVHALLLRAHTALWSGDPVGAVAHVRAAVARSRPSTMAPDDVATIVLAAAGMPDEAAVHLDCLEAYVGDRPADRVAVLWSRAELAAARGEQAAARSAFTEAIAVLDALGEVPKATRLRGRLRELGLG